MQFGSLLSTPEFDVTAADLSGAKAAVLMHRSDHFHLEPSGFYHTALLLPRCLRFQQIQMFSLNCRCLSRLSRVQDCHNGISMELFLHFSLLPAVSASLLHFHPPKLTIHHLICSRLFMDFDSSRFSSQGFSHSSRRESKDWQ